MNNDVPFSIIEIIKNDDKLQLCVRYCDFNLEVVKERYDVLKNIINNPLIIFNGFMSELSELSDKQICDLKNNCF